MSEAVFTQKQFMEMMAEINRQNVEMLKAQSVDSDVRMMKAIKEFKKPLPHEQAKIDKEIELERRKLTSAPLIAKHRNK